MFKKLADYESTPSEGSCDAPSPKLSEPPSKTLRVTSISMTEVTGRATACAACESDDDGNAQIVSDAAAYHEDDGASVNSGSSSASSTPNDRKRLRDADRDSSDDGSEKKHHAEQQSDDDGDETPIPLSPMTVKSSNASIPRPSSRKSTASSSSASLPPSPKHQCDEELEARVLQYTRLRESTGKVLNAAIIDHPDFSNPYMLEKLIKNFEIYEYVSNIPKHVFDWKDVMRWPKCISTSHTESRAEIASSSKNEKDKSAPSGAAKLERRRTAI